MQSEMNIIKIHHRDWAVPHLTLECPFFHHSSSAMLRVSSSRPHCSVNKIKEMSSGIALK